MRIIFFGNNDAAVDTLKYLMGTKHDLVGLVVHQPDRQKRGRELVEISGLPEDRVFFGNDLGSRATIRKMAELEPDVGVSVFFGYILRRRILDLFEVGCVNVHPALLPYNRGACPNVWSIIEGTPAGVTMHLMDEGVDTGPIISQKAVQVNSWDTGLSLYHRLEEACVDLFVQSWPQFVNGDLKPQPQEGRGTEHRTRDVMEVDSIDLYRKYRAGELINIMRARSCPPHKGAYFVADGRKVFVNLELEPEGEDRND